MEEILIDFRISAKFESPESLSESVVEVGEGKRAQS